MSKGPFLTKGTLGKETIWILQTCKKCSLHITGDPCWRHVLGHCMDVSHCVIISWFSDSFLSVKRLMSRPIRGLYWQYWPIRGWMSVSTWLDIINIVQGPTVPHCAMMIKLGQILKECPDHSLLSTDPLNDLQEAVQKCPDFWEHEGL